jgi:molybdopterin-guanine dinucleotide biosynthesis protein A
MSDQIIISILTGGKSSRMEFQNKSFLKIYNKTFIELLLDQLKILEYEIVINVNDDEEKYSKFGFQLVADKIKGRKGPLAGLHSVMSLYKKTKKDIWFAMLPTDAPLINLNLFKEFEKIQNKNKNSYISKIDGIIEPMFSFWSINSFEKLDRILNLNDGYKIMKFAEEVGFEYLNIKKEKKLEFFNINNLDDYNLFKSSY